MLYGVTKIVVVGRAQEPNAIFCIAKGNSSWFLSHWLTVIKLEVCFANFRKCGIYPTVKSFNRRGTPTHGGTGPTH